MGPQIWALSKTLGCDLTGEAKWKAIREIMDVMIEEFRHHHKAGGTEQYSPTQRKLIDLYHDSLVVLHKARAEGRDSNSLYESFYRNCLDILHPVASKSESITFTNLVTRLRTTGQELQHLRLELEGLLNG
jgi:hypothetical protein